MRFHTHQGREGGHLLAGAPGGLEDQRHVAGGALAQEHSIGLLA